MGILGAILGKQRVQLIQNGTTVVQLDVSEKEEHGRESPPTQFPVENGDTISDHIIIRPFELTLTGIISDTPIGGIKGLLTEAATTLASALVPPIPLVGGASGALGVGVAAAIFSALSGSKNPSVAAYGQLLQLQANAQPVDVLTSLYRYPSMWISSISAPRDSSTGQVLYFTLKLVQLILVSPQTVNINIFANPGLSANQGDLGQNSANLPNGFAAGQKAFNNLVGGAG